MKNRCMEVWNISPTLMYLLSSINAGVKNNFNLIIIALKITAMCQINPRFDTNTLHNLIYPLYYIAFNFFLTTMFMVGVHASLMLRDHKK